MPQTIEGYQAWEVLLKLPEPNLSVALDIARNLKLDDDIMSELLPIAVLGMKSGFNKKDF